MNIPFYYVRWIMRLRKGNVSPCRRNRPRNRVLSSLNFIDVWGWKVDEIESVRRFMRPVIDLLQKEEYLEKAVDSLWRSFGCTGMHVLVHFMYYCRIVSCNRI